MKGKVFIDTNLFVYAKLEEEENITKRKNLIAFFETLSNEILISTQVINEIYSTMLKNKVADEDIQEMILEILNDVEVGLIKVSTIQSAWQLKEKYKVSYWDSLIISSALETGCEILYSEDMHHNQLIEDQLRIINPLL